MPKPSSTQRAASARRTNAQRRAAARGQAVNLRPNTIAALNRQRNTGGSFFSRALRGRMSRGYQAAAARNR